MANFLLIAVFGIFLPAANLTAVEKTTTLPSYRLIGTICGHSNPNLDVLVVQNIKSSRTYTARIGETFGSVEKFQVLKILDKQAWVKDHEQQVYYLEYSPWIASEDAIDSSNEIQSLSEDDVLDAIEEQDSNPAKLTIKLQEFRPVHSGFFD